MRKATVRRIVCVMGWMLLVAPGFLGAAAYASDITGDLNFTLQDLDGKDVTLSDYLGKPIIVLFWATYCPTCKEEIPYVNQFYKENRGSDLVLYSITMDKKSPEKLRAAVERRGAKFPVLMGDSRLARKWGVRAIPAAFMINRSGNIAHRLSGLNLSVDMKRYLDEISAP